MFAPGWYSSPGVLAVAIVLSKVIQKGLLAAPLMLKLYICDTVSTVSQNFLAQWPKLELKQSHEGTIDSVGPLATSSLEKKNLRHCSRNIYIPGQTFYIIINMWEPYIYQNSC